MSDSPLKADMCSAPSRVRFLQSIEDNWLEGQRIQPGGSFDTIAGTLNNMFDFDRKNDEPRRLFLDEMTGAIVEVVASHGDGDQGGDNQH
jgi:phospholipase C